MKIRFQRKMIHRDLLAVILVYLPCLLGLDGLQITLDGFGPDCPGCRNAFATYRVIGRITVEAGDKIPDYILFEFMCPLNESCLRERDIDEGTWQLRASMKAGQCDYNDPFSSCMLQSDGSYSIHCQLYLYYPDRFCKARARFSDVESPSAEEAPQNRTEVVSNIRDLAEYANNADAYDPTFDEQFEALDDVCFAPSHSLNGIHQLGPSRDGALVYLSGVFLAANMLRFH